MISETLATRNRLIKDFKAVMRDAEELLKVTAGQTGDRIAAARERAEETLSDARRKISEMESDLVDRTKAAATATDELVHRNPWEVIAVATVVGFVLGMFTTRR